MVTLIGQKEEREREKKIHQSAHFFFFRSCVCVCFLFSAYGPEPGLKAPFGFRCPTSDTSYWRASPRERKGPTRPT